MTQHNKHTFSFRKLFIPFVVFSVLFACSEDVPKKEDVPELITQATLTFTPQEGDPIMVTATDPDGEGVQPIEINGNINLSANTTYILTITLNNTIVTPSDPSYDITAEVEEEGDEHMFFFGWTGNVFSDPSGNGNIDNRADAVNYSGGENSLDENGLPLGLTTTWTTSSTGEGTFNVILKHQPEIKSETSGSDIGETDLMLAFPIHIIE